MVKNTYRIKIPYLYNPDRRGAKYSFDSGQTYCNGGDAHEILVKDCKGYPPRKDANTAFDLDSDIPEIRASVKSSKATLTSKYLGSDLDTILQAYFSTVHSKLWIWAVKLEEDLITYEMDRTEFEEFTRQWAGYDANRKVVRYKITSTIMIKWLEDRVLPGRATQGKTWPQVARVSR